MNERRHSKALEIAGILLVLFVFIISNISQVFNYTVKDVVGTVMWHIIYVFLPAVALIVPFIMKRIKRFSAKLISVCSLGITVIYVLLMLIVPTSVNTYIRSFTESKWTRYKYERKLMLEDLEEDYYLIGMSKGDILNLLGAADSEEEEEWEYVIASGWVDPEMFVIKFKDGNVIDFYTYIEFKP